MGVGIVVVSHSAKIAEGVCELAGQMAGPEVKLLPAGGLDENTLGTNAERIHSALDQAETGDGVLILVDLGSAIMSAEIAIEMLAEDRQGRVAIANAPLVEGAVVAAVQASVGSPLAEVKQNAEGAAAMQKLK